MLGFNSFFFRLWLATRFFVPVAVQVRNAISIIAALGTKLVIDKGLRRASWSALALQTFPCATSKAIRCHKAGGCVVTDDTIGSRIRSQVLLFLNTTICSFIGLPLFGTSLSTKVLVEPVGCRAALRGKVPIGAGFTILLHPWCYFVLASDAVAILVEISV